MVSWLVRACNAMVEVRGQYIIATHYYTMPARPKFNAVCEEVDSKQDVWQLGCSVSFSFLPSVFSWSRLFASFFPFLFRSLAFQSADSLGSVGAGSFRGESLS